MASVRANPKIATLNKSFVIVGFLEIPKIKELKISPIPIPAPVSPNVASPAPIFCAACNSIKIRSELCCLGPVRFELTFLPL